MSRKANAQKRQEVARTTGRTFVEVIDPTHADFASIDATDSKTPLIVVDEEIPSELMVRVLTVELLGQTAPSEKEGFVGMVFDRYQVRGNYKATNQNLFTWKIVPQGEDPPFKVGSFAMFPGVHIPHGSVALSSNGENYIRPTKSVGCYQSTSMKTAMEMSADEIFAIFKAEAVSLSAQAVEPTTTSAKVTV